MRELNELHGGRRNALRGLHDVSVAWRAVSGVGAAWWRGASEPATRATGNIHRGIMAGKLKGAMPAQTPRGTLYGHVRVGYGFRVYGKKHLVRVRVHALGHILQRFAHQVVRRTTRRLNNLQTSDNVSTSRVRGGACICT